MLIDTVPHDDSQRREAVRFFAAAAVWNLLFFVVRSAWPDWC